MNWISPSLEHLPVSDLQHAREMVAALKRRPVARGRDGNDEARQRMEVAQAREEESKGTVNLDLLW
jgi:hypothetical protein